MPSLSNELSPFPLIHFGEVSSNGTAVDQRTIFPRLRRGVSLRSGNTVVSTKHRARSSSDAGALAAHPPVRNRSGSTSFGSTRGYEDVHELLKLRKQKLKEAHHKGDEIELQRLKNLHLFDDIERPQPEIDEPKEVGVSVDFTGQSDHHGFTLQTDDLGSDFIPRPKSVVNQGHTATLCWHLKLDYTQGLAVPEEFSQCTIHPTPSLGASSDSSSTPQPASPGSISSGSISSLSHMKVSSIDSSVVRDSSEPSSPATTSSKGICSEATLSTKASSLVLSQEEDPFLYIAKYINKHAKRDRHEEVNNSASQAFNADTRRSTHTQCTCTNHNCRIYLSGSPSKHCRNCRLPRLQPEIIAAAERIEQMKISAVSARAVTDQVSEADEYRNFEALQEDMKLVEMYMAETEKRCRNGVWWEGWLIVQDLKRQGIVGSIPFVYARDNSPAQDSVDHGMVS